MSAHAAAPQVIVFAGPNGAGKFRTPEDIEVDPDRL